MDFKQGNMTPANFNGIKGGQRMTVSFKPLLGLLNPKKILESQIFSHGIGNGTMLIVS